MSLKLIPKNTPFFTALSTDISANKIDGLSTVGALVFITDSQIWKIVLPDLTLANYVESSFVSSGSVAISSVGAGENHIGQVGGHVKVASATPTLSTAGAYVANDFVGTNATPIEFTSVARVSGGSGIIQYAVLVDYALQSKSAELWLFSSSVTPPNDNAPWSISDADALNCIGIIPFSIYRASALNSISIADSLGIVFKATATSIWGCLVTRGDPTYATGDITIKLSILQD